MDERTLGQKLSSNPVQQEYIDQFNSFEITHTDDMADDANMIASVEVFLDHLKRKAHQLHIQDRNLQKEWNRAIITARTNILMG